MQPKLSFFAWEASWGRVLTLDHLQKRSWALANRYFLCQTFEESIDHLLLHCEKNKGSVDVAPFFIWSILGVSVMETLLGWRGSFVDKKRKEMWQVGLLCLLGHLEGKE